MPMSVKRVHLTCKEGTVYEEEKLINVMKNENGEHLFTAGKIIQGCLNQWLTGYNFINSEFLDKKRITFLSKDSFDLLKKLVQAGKIFRLVKSNPPIRVEQFFMKHGKNGFLNFSLHVVVFRYNRYVIDALKSENFYTEDYGYIWSKACEIAIKYVNYLAKRQSGYDYEVSLVEEAAEKGLDKWHKALVEKKYRGKGAIIKYLTTICRNCYFDLVKYKRTPISSKTSNVDIRRQMVDCIGEKWLEILDKWAIKKIPISNLVVEYGMTEEVMKSEIEKSIKKLKVCLKDDEDNENGYTASDY